MSALDLVLGVLGQAVLFCFFVWDMNVHGYVVDVLEERLHLINVFTLMEQGLPTLSINKLVYFRHNVLGSIGIHTRE